MSKQFYDDEEFSEKHLSNRKNPRKYPCPDCGRKNVMTKRDIDAGYSCKKCEENNDIE